MRKLTILFILLVSTVMFSSPSYAKWTKLGENMSGNTIYLDFERIRKHDGYVYWWHLIDYLKPDLLGHLSSKRYHQGDCKLFRFKKLSYVDHNQPMGRDIGDSNSPKNPKWTYPTPNSIDESNLKQVCSR